MTNTAWLVIALAITFIAIGGYSVSLVARRKALEERLQSHLDGAETRR